jgi:hypothetical protein
MLPLGGMVSVLPRSVSESCSYANLLAEQHWLDIYHFYPCHLEHVESLQLNQLIGIYHIVTFHSFKAKRAISHKEDRS